ncbi:tetratricopeptide repeat protein [Maribacter sp. IgM3_T14_3]|uniref:tetratricopeptide repeat protein n=1 Tax=Maribacter sp. IgM3_T14_3 TaxID=3415140 RepID=UPI003C6F01C2
MKLLLNIVICTVLAANVYCQETKKIDSIKYTLSATKDVTKRLYLHHELFELLKDSDKNSAKLHIDSLLTLAYKIDNNYFIARGNIGLGYYHYINSNFIESEKETTKGIYILDSLNQKEHLPYALNQLGITQKYLGKFEEALLNHQKSADINMEIKGQPIDLARSYLNMGNVLAEVRNFESSTENYKKAEKISIDNNLYDFLAKVWGNIAANYMDVKEYEKALEFHNKGLKLMEENPSVALTRTYNNIGVVYDQLSDFKTAKEYYQKALKTSDKYGEPQLTGLIIRNLGEIYFAEQNYPKALENIEKSIMIAKESKNSVRLIRGYMKMAEVHAALGNYKNAYEYDRMYADLKDSIRGLDVRERINNLEIKYQTEKKEIEIALQEEEINTLNEKSKVDKLTKGLYAGGMASALALFGLSVFGYRQRIKKNQIAREKQDEIYKQEIAYKKKELTSQTLHLVQKNTFIQELMENFENIKNSPEKFKMEFRRIVMLLKKENASDKDWEVFKTYFAEVHNDFDQKLKTLYADISEKEIRLAAFLRMNLTTKEIAATLNVLPESILTSKYRLKKKLNLDKETDLTTFLSSL